MVTKLQLKKWRKESAELRRRSKVLSKKHKVKIHILDLNPSFTRTNKKKFFRDAGHANTETKTIDIDERIPKRFQGRVIKHEKLHLEHPRATEKEIEDMTFKKYGWKHFEKARRDN